MGKFYSLFFLYKYMLDFKEYLLNSSVFKSVGSNSSNVVKLEDAEDKRLFKKLL